MTTAGRYSRYAYTLVEMMIVVAIIGVLGSIAVPQVIRAVNKAKEKQAEADLEMISTAVRMLAADTGKWPCISSNTLKTYTTFYNGGYWNDEVYDLGTPLAGLMTGTVHVAYGYDWKGPYIHEIPTDPWGNRYEFDPDYRVYYGKEVGRLSTTPNYPESANAPVVLSWGPNRRGSNNVYDADNIYIVVGKVY